MISLNSNLRKELAYAIVDMWAVTDEGKERILSTYIYQQCNTRHTSILLTSETYHANKALVDNSFFKLIDMIFEEIIEAVDDWIDVYKVLNYEDFLARKGKTNLYGT